jgi:hypothetical protein
MLVVEQQLQHWTITNNNSVCHVHSSTALAITTGLRLVASSAQPSHSGTLMLPNPDNNMSSCSSAS